MAAIKGVQGVKGAFFEGRHEPVTDPDFWDMRDHSTDSSPDLGTASRMTGAAAASQRGQGQVIEVIDVGVDTSHEAFAGSLDAASARLTHQAMASLTPSLGAGKDGAWVSTRSPSRTTTGTGIRTRRQVTRAAERRSRAHTSRPLRPRTAPPSRGPRRELSSSSRRSPATARTRPTTLRSWRPSTTRRSSSPMPSPSPSRRSRG